MTHAVLSFSLRKNQDFSLTLEGNQPIKAISDGPKLLEGRTRSLKYSGLRRPLNRPKFDLCPYNMIIG